MAARDSRTVGRRKTIRFCFSVVVVLLRNSVPKPGISPRRGTRELVEVSLSLIKPPIMITSLSSTSIVVSIVLVLVMMSALPCEPIAPSEAGSTSETSDESQVG